ncbi:hypothetical protein LJC36_04845 [Desulfovibrio sp. OttesenSCG-928-C14]|nr:hypothetical protein [Desulfovibrio sp. OttesenSCG-928-C14]
MADWPPEAGAFWLGASATPAAGLGAAPAALGGPGRAGLASRTSLTGRPRRPGFRSGLSGLTGRPRGLGRFRGRDVLFAVAHGGNAVAHEKIVHTDAEGLVAIFIVEFFEQKIAVGQAPNVAARSDGKFVSGLIGLGVYAQKSWPCAHV